MFIKKYISLFFLFTMIGCTSQDELFYGIPMNEKVDSSFKKVQDNKSCKKDPKNLFDDLCVYTNSDNLIYKIELTKRKTMIDEKTGLFKSWKSALAIKDELKLKYQVLQCNNLHERTFNTLVGFECSTMHQKTKINFKVINPTGINGRGVSVTNIHPYILLTYETINEQGF